MAASAACAAVIPPGLQSNVTQATVDGWGWTEIHRSDPLTVASEASIISAATGDYMMMGVWDNTLNVYSILVAGPKSVVTNFTYADYQSDNGGTTLNNWSNGLNFYRTQGFGAWGFTTNTLTELNVTDILLIDGLQSQHGQTERVLSTGLTLRQESNGDLGNYSHAFNVAGINFTGIFGEAGRYERVFFTDEQPAPVQSTTRGRIKSLLDR